MEASQSKKAGPITLALGLIIIGSLLLVAKVTGLGIMSVVLKYWPLLLIGLGVEYFIRSFLNKKQYGEETETRFHFPTVIVILALTFIIFAGQQAVNLLKNQNLNSLIDEALAGTKYSYEYKFKSEPLSVKPGVTKIRINERNGLVDLVPSTDGKVYVEADIVAWGPSDREAQRRAEEVKFNIRAGDVIDISRSSDFPGHFQRQPRVAVRVLIPAGVDVSIDNGFGNIRADNIEADLEVRSDGGNIKLSKINGDVYVDGRNGQVQCFDINGSLEADVDHGNVLVKNVTNTVRINAESGKVEATSTNPVKHDYSITNKFGEITLRIPKTSDVAIKAHTSAGKIKGTMNVQTQSIGDNSNQPDPRKTGPEAGLENGTTGTAVLGGGKAAINLSTEEGNIVIDEN